MLPIKSILVPIDFSKTSYDAFELGYRLAKLNGAKLHIVHVIDPANYDEDSLKISENVLVQQLRKKNAAEELQKFKFEVPHSNIEITEALIEGIPYKAILSYARKNEIDMIVMASQGWTNLPHVTMGGIADKIMLQSKVPVVCVKSNFLSN